MEIEMAMEILKRLAKVEVVTKEPPGEELAGALELALKLLEEKANEELKEAERLRKVVTHLKCGKCGGDEIQRRWDAWQILTILGEDENGEEIYSVYEDVQDFDDNHLYCGSCTEKLDEDDDIVRSEEDADDDES